VALDDVVRRHLDQPVVLRAPGHRQLEGAKAHKGRRDAAHHRAGLELDVAWSRWGGGGQGKQGKHEGRPSCCQATHRCMQLVHSPAAAHGKQPAAAAAAAAAAHSSQPPAHRCKTCPCTRHPRCRCSTARAWWGPAAGAARVVGGGSTCRAPAQCAGTPGSGTAAGPQPVPARPPGGGGARAAGQQPAAHPQVVHRLAGDELADAAAQHGAPVGAPRVGRAAGALRGGAGQGEARCCWGAGRCAPGLPASGALAGRSSG
jgi:hypothetical protein